MKVRRSTYHPIRIFRSPSRLKQHSPWTVQALAGKTPTKIQRKSVWDKYKKQREHKAGAVPKTFNYEMINHRMVAHSYNDSEIDKAIAVIVALHSFYKSKVDQKAIKTAFSALRKGKKAGEYVELDMTSYLPANLKTYLSNLEKHYGLYRDFMKAHGTPEDVFAKKGDIDAFYKKRYDYFVKHGGAGTSTFSREEASACHDLTMMVINRGISKDSTQMGDFDYDGHIGGKRSGATDFARDQLGLSIQGKGPFKKIAQADVKIGDILVIQSDGAVKEVQHGVMHSAIVIRADGENDIEVLEKKNDFKPMATRTLSELKASYKSDKPNFYFLRR